jgi:hypothetical protein
MAGLERVAAESVVQLAPERQWLRRVAVLAVHPRSDEQQNQLAVLEYVDPTVREQRRRDGQETTGGAVTGKRSGNDSSDGNAIPKLT